MSGRSNDDDDEGQLGLSAEDDRSTDDVRGPTTRIEGWSDLSRGDRVTSEHNEVRFMRPLLTR